VEPTRFAILDADWATRAAAWPQLGAELTGRALSRALRLVITMAIAQQPRLDVRLWMLFWELADRYGKVKPDGVHIELPLTHELLSHLAGARRPSVSASLTRLAASGRLFRSGRDWVLTGEPPPTEDSAVA
jgi:CRP-like cAMP-binding protein